MTDTARHADVVLPATTQLEHLDAALLLGPSLPDLQRAGDRAAAARRSRTPRPSGCSPRAWASTTRAFAETDEAMLAVAVRERVRGRDARGPTRARLDEDATSARARRLTPRAASGRPTGKVAAAHPTASRRRHRPAAVLRPARRGHRRGARGAPPARAGHAQDAPVPELDVPQPGPPARGPAGALRGAAPRRRGARAGSRDGALVRVFNDRGAFEVRGPGLRRHPPRRGGRADGLVGGGLRDRRSAAQATTSQRLTELGRGADVQRQPRRGRSGLTGEV